MAPDLVVFNGSLHYAPYIAATLARAHRMLAPGGALVVMDSPMFRRDRDGAAMVDDKHTRFRRELGRLRRARGIAPEGPAVKRCRSPSTDKRSPSD